MAPSESLHLTQSSILPPAQPSYVLRGHSAQVHAIHFFRENLRLITGDADGWIVLWNVPIRRPVAVWKSHNATILGVKTWGDDKIVTLGRDSKMQVWQLRPEDENTYSTTLPIEDSSDTDRKRPWLLHSLLVNTINFCSFAMGVLPKTDVKDESGKQEDEIILATSGVQDGTIILTKLPSEARHSTIPAPRNVKTGMLMAIGIHIPNKPTTEISGSDRRFPEIFVLAGYESGHASLWHLNCSNRWEVLYTHKSHTQPILSIGIASDSQYWFTSSADAAIVRHLLQPTSAGQAEESIKTVQTKHAGQQGLQVRSDEKVFATAGWDGRMRVYGTKSMRELAVLKWHREGCYALAFAEILEDGNDSKAKPESTADGAVEEETIHKKTRSSLSVAEQRNEKTKATHWIAAGSKDGKVSLWEIY